MHSSRMRIARFGGCHYMSVTRISLQSLPPECLPPGGLRPERVGPPERTPPQDEPDPTGMDHGMDQTPP